MEIDNSSATLLVVHFQIRQKVKNFINNVNEHISKEKKRICNQHIRKRIDFLTLFYFVSWGSVALFCNGFTRSSFFHFPFSLLY